MEKQTMQLQHVFSVFKKERLGLTLIVSVLVVIGVIVYLTSFYHQRTLLEHMRAQGTDLMRVISRMPIEQILPEANQPSIFLLFTESQVDANFAYVQVTGVHGEPLLEQAALDVVIPAPAESQETAGWLDERTVVLNDDSDPIQEFRSVLVKDGQPVGHIRIGYFHPRMSLHLDQLPIVASLALPIFLLAPIFHLLLKMEFRPLREIDNQLNDLAIRNLPGPGALQNRPNVDLVSRINQFMDTVTDRIDQLKADRTGLETATKLDTFKRSRLESVLQSIPDGVMVLDELGAVSLATEKLGHMLGVNAGDILDKKPIDWFADSEVVNFLGRHVGITKSAKSHSIEFSAKASPDRILSMSSYPMFEQKDPQHKIGTLVFLRDITAETLVRNSSSEFVAHVAHELKSPLTVLSMYSETLLGADGDNENFRIEAANVIRDEVERLGMMINNILNITKLETGSLGIERQRVKLRDLIVDVFNTFSRGANEKNLRFEMDIPKELSAAALDKELMRVALNNLLTNAIKYSDADGAVTLCVREAEDSISISVRDEGIGISEDDQERIFEKFTRGDNQDVQTRPGHGLGLALAREIVMLHQGSLRVESQLGKGSEFTIEISKESNLLRRVG